MVPNFTSLPISYLITTSLHIAIEFALIYLAVVNNMLIISVVGGEYSTHSCSRCELFYLQVTRGLGETGSNFLCNMDTTQPIEILLPPQSYQTTQLCAVDIFYTIYYGPFNRSPPFPLQSSPTAIIPLIAFAGGPPAQDALHFVYPPAFYSMP